MAMNIGAYQAACVEQGGKTQWRSGGMKWWPSLPFRERKFYLRDVNIQKPWFPALCVWSAEIDFKETQNYSACCLAMWSPETTRSQLPTLDKWVGAYLLCPVLTQMASCALDECGPARQKWAEPSLSIDKCVWPLGVPSTMHFWENLKPYAPNNKEVSL